MIAPTHIAFALACGNLAGVSAVSLNLLAAGSLLPDIDHPQSSIGRILFFFSIPLNRQFGHRRIIHGFALWGAVALAGIFWTPALWIGLGALSHIVLDLLNISGVQALMPFSEKVCVLFARKWRFASGSRQDLVLLVVLGVFAWAGNYIGTLGGLRALTGVITGSPRIAYQQYLEAGTQISFIEGTLRHRDGRIEHGRWLAIGKEEERGLALWNEKRQEIIHLPRQAEFLSAYLKRTGERWQTLSLTGWARTKREAFFFDGEFWRHAEPGSIVFGWVLGREMEVEAMARVRSQNGGGF